MINNDKNILYEIVGSNIRQFRQSKKMNQLTLSSKINLSRTSLVNIEHGKQHSSLILLHQIAQSLDVTLHDLIPKSFEEKSESIEKIITLTKDSKNEKVLDFLNSRVYLKTNKYNEQQTSKTD